jgi:hypothetical protein
MPFWMIRGYSGADVVAPRFVNAWREYTGGHAVQHLQRREYARGALTLVALMGTRSRPWYLALLSLRRGPLLEEILMTPHWVIGELSALCGATVIDTYRALFAQTVACGNAPVIAVIFTRASTSVRRRFGGAAAASGQPLSVFLRPCWRTSLSVGVPVLAACAPM